MTIRALLLCTLSAVALADFFSDWKDGPCPTAWPAHSYYCSSYTSSGTTYHRHKCYSIDDTMHYCGDECDETCTALQGGGATDAVCPGACANGVCKAEGSPVSAHCYCNAGWTGVHCNIQTGTGSNPPAVDYCMTDEFTGAALAAPINCNHGTCKNGDKGYSCVCDAGWSGFHCMTSGTTQPAAGTWERAILDKHNSVRANIKQATKNEEPLAQTVKGLKWDYDLAENARLWAATGKNGIFTCSALAHSPQAFRSSKTPYSYIGENLWAAGSSGTTPIDPVTAVTSWVSEYTDFDYASNTCASGKACGHYTQVVWANTQAIGCALTTVPCSTFTWTVVACQYAEGGNWVGQKPYVSVADGATTVVA